MIFKSPKTRMIHQRLQSAEISFQSQSQERDHTGHSLLDSILYRIAGMVHLSGKQLKLLQVVKSGT